MADRTALRAAIKRRLANRSDVTDADADRWLDDGLLDLATQRIHIRELESIGSAIPSQVGVAAYTIPAAAFAILYLVDTTNSRVLDRYPGTFESFLRAQQAESPTTNDVPTHFIEFGAQFHVTLTPQVTTINWTPYVYTFPTFTSDASAVPGIPTFYHYGLELVAAQHGFRELGDEERAQIAEQEWIAWLQKRDSARRRTTRFNAPTRGIGPHPASINRRTGV